MPIKNKEIKESIERVKNIDDVLTRSVQEYVRRFCLDVKMETIDQSLKELLEMRADRLVNLTPELLQQYLFNVSKWAIAVSHQINLRKVQSDKLARDYLVALRYEKYGKITNKLTGKSEKEKEDKLLAQNEKLQKLETDKMTAQAFYDAIKGYDQHIDRMHFTLQRILIQKEIGEKNSTRTA